MTTIQLQVKDELIEQYGKMALQNRLQRFLDLEQMHLLATKIQEAVNESGEDHDDLWQQARNNAWKTFKQQLNLPK